MIAIVGIRYRNYVSYTLYRSCLLIHAVGHYSYITLILI